MRIGTIRQPGFELGALIADRERSVATVRQGRSWSHDSSMILHDFHVPANAWQSGSGSLVPRLPEAVLPEEATRPKMPLGQQQFEAMKRCGEFAAEDSALVGRRYGVACIPGNHLPKNVGVRKKRSASLLVRTRLWVVKHSLLGTHRSCITRFLCRASSRGPRLLLSIIGASQTPTLADGASTAQPVEAIRPTMPRARSRSVCLTGKGSGVNGWRVMPATAASRKYRLIA